MPFPILDENWFVVNVPIYLCGLDSSRVLLLSFFEDPARWTQQLVLLTSGFAALRTHTRGAMVLRRLFVLRNNATLPARMREHLPLIASLHQGYVRLVDKYNRFWNPIRDLNHAKRT